MVRRLWVLVVWWCLGPASSQDGAAGGRATKSVRDRRRTAPAQRRHQLPGSQGQFQGRLNQWAHWARAHRLRIFFFLRGPQLAVVK